MRGFLYLAIFLIVGCLQRDAGAEETPSPPEGMPPDSAEIATDSAAVGSPRVLTLYLERGQMRRVLSIEPRSDGIAAVKGVDGSTEYITLNKIRRVEDVLGVDRTGYVVRDRHWLGLSSPSIGGWKNFRHVAGPKSVCGSYLITDTALLWRMSGSNGGHYEKDKEQMLSVDWGYARNVGDATSVGGTAFFLGDRARVRSGLRVRLVRWLGSKVSLDVAPGIVLLANEEGYAEFKGPGFSGQAGLTFAGLGGIVTEVTSVTRHEGPYAFTNPNSTVHETNWHAGARLSGVPGVATGVTLGALIVGALIAMSSSGGWY